MNHSKTTILGILTILGALVHIAVQYFSGTPVDYSGTLAGIMAGIGLIKAADGSNVPVIK